MIRMPHLYSCGSEQNFTNESISIYRADTIVISEKWHTIALSGAFPTPKKWLAEHQNNPNCLNTIQLEDLVRIDALEETFKKMIESCKHNKIDALIINAAPASFYGLKETFALSSISIVEAYLNQIAPQLQKILENLMQTVPSNTSILLALPSKENLMAIFSKPNINDFVQELVEGFPKLSEIKKNQEAVILSNGGSPYADILVERFQNLYPEFKKWEKIYFSDQETLFQYR